MTKSIEFKTAQFDDLPRIMEIYNSTIASRMVTADTELVTVESRLDWFHEHNPQTRPLNLILLHNEIVGWISYQSFYGRPAYQRTAEISIYLDSSCRGKGVGSAALQKAVEDAPSLGINTLLGFIFAHNTPSLSLFSKFGFEQWACLPKIALLDETECDLIIMGKRLL